MEQTNLIGIFLTGLLTGGLTCMAVQGGLLAATIAQRQQDRVIKQAKKGTVVPILSFLSAKLITYTLLGFFLGLLGSVFQLSITTQAILQFVVVIFMIGTALNILDVHPVFRYFVIQPPRFLTRIIRKESKSNNIFAPVLLGALTIFIPCGTTQAMMALAVASGKPLYGAAILFSFVLGTSPVFFLLGYGMTKLGETLQQKFMKYAAFAIIFLALYNLNGAIALTGSTLTFDNIAKNIWCTVSWCKIDVPAGNDKTANMPTQQATIIIGENGYSPTSFTIKTGTTINLTLKNTGGAGCTQTFTIPSLGLQKIIPLGTTNQLAFVAPTQEGDIPFMCSMGMYRGVIHVVKG